jgi:hypothetical protein
VTLNKKMIILQDSFEDEIGSAGEQPISNKMNKYMVIKTETKWSLFLFYTSTFLWLRKLIFVIEIPLNKISTMLF